MQNYFKKFVTMKKKTYLCAFFSKLERCVAYVGMLVCVLHFSACKDVVSPSQESATITNRPVRRSMAPADFPSTSAAVLEQRLNEEPELLCPFMANAVATYEMQDGKYEMYERLRQGTIYDETQSGEYQYDPTASTWHLTELPRMILDVDGSVKYYEYGLVEDNEITGIITVYAKREAPCAIAYMIPYVLPYEHTDQDYCDIGVYPCRVFNDGVGYRTVEDSGEQNTYLNFLLDDDEDPIEDQLSPEDLSQLNELRTRVSEPDVEYDNETTIYWSAIDDAYLALEYDLGLGQCMDIVTFGGDGYGPSYVINTYVQRLWDYLGTRGACYDYTARPYCNTQLQQTYWTGACGPAALAWIYRGLRSAHPWSNGTYLPLHGDGTQLYFNDNLPNHSYYYYQLQNLKSLGCSDRDYVKSAYVHRSADVDNGLTANFYEYCYPVKVFGDWEFILLPWDLDNAFLDATNNIYTVACDCSAITAANHIQSNNLPVMLLQSNLQHYLIAYGYGGIIVPGQDIERKNLYFLIMDNGYTISHNNYKPYWRAYQKQEFYYRVLHN